MRVSIIKDDVIQNIILPEKVEGSYWIKNTKALGTLENLICIEGVDNEWKIVANDEVYPVINGEKAPYAILKENKFYSLFKALDNSNILIYTSPIKLKYNVYEVTNFLKQGIIIGSGNKSQINYKILDSENAIIKAIDNKIFIYNNNSQIGTYLNNVKVIKYKEIKSGDIIFIMGLKIIFIEKMTQIGPRMFILVNDATLTSVNVTNLLLTNIEYDKELPFTENQEEIEMPIYNEDDYFYKKPRLNYIITPLDVKVDDPPAKYTKEETPVLLTIGPMLTLSMTSLVTGYMSVNNVIQGNMTFEKAIPSLVICVSMLLSILLWPFITRLYMKIYRKNQDKVRTSKYTKYIESKYDEINKEKEKQIKILNDNYPSITEVENIILNKNDKLWQRRITDEDFLSVSLGKGKCKMKINMKKEEEHFTLTNDELKDMMQKLINEDKFLEDVPITVNLMKNYIQALIGEEKYLQDEIDKIILQLVAFQSYDNLKIVILTDEDNSYKWKYLKSLPYLMSNDRQIRFFGTNNNEYKEICYYLDRVMQSRIDAFKETKTDSFNQVYLIITDNFKNIRDFDIFNNILNKDKYYGFNLILLDNKISNLPDKCKNIIELENDYGTITNSDNVMEHQNFTLDYNTYVDYEACVKSLANIPILIDNKEEGQLPDKVGFLEMYDVGKVEQLNSALRWKEKNPILSLQAPVGIGRNGEKITIDLHEKFHGPHGLIAGMTGSGKSEFIITYILSMALNYHPNEVQFILIDYKGGGLAGAFENNNLGFKLPHLVGTITNLDANEIKRSLSSVESELKRRQALFNKAREISGESTIDIYKYQKMYRDGLVEEPVSHLFIISDEFAELKQQQPEFMNQLISTARIGRSLGVHLILATQKPSGVVDPQIWSNTRFRVCLRVQEKSDSNEVIKCPDAAYLKQTGRFYFQVGYNEIFVLGQAAYAGGKYIESSKVKKTIDSKIDFIDNIGYIIKQTNTVVKQENITSKGEELTNIIKYLSDIAKAENIKCKSLWLPKIPNFIKVTDLIEKYKFTKNQNDISVVVGEVDIPNKQMQKLLTISYQYDGNCLCYGISGSGKEKFITSILYSSLILYTPEDVNYYIIDFGSGTLKMFDNSYMVGNIMTIDDKEKIDNLYKMLNTIIQERKKLFQDYNGDYENYIKNSGKKVPSIVVIINNYELYQENYSNADDLLNVITRECVKYGIYFVITVTTPNGIRFKLKQNFSKIFALQQNNVDDYTTILGNVSKTYPSKMIGRGIIKTDNVYEFQTASVYEEEKLKDYIKEEVEKYNSKYLVKAKKVPVLPEEVSYKDIKMSFNKDKSLVIGLDKATLNTVNFDFTKNFTSIITSLDISNIKEFVNPLINQILALNSYNLIVINASDITLDEKYTNYYNYINNNFNEIFNELEELSSDKYEIYKANNYKNNIFKDNKKTYCIIIGVDNFRNKLNDAFKQKFQNMFNNFKNLDLVTFILIDSIDKIKKIELEPWYKNCVSNNDGIYIGNGINDQFSLRYTTKLDEMKQDVPNKFCFVIKKGKPMYVKYVTKFELNIKD